MQFIRFIHFISVIRITDTLCEVKGIASGAPAGYWTGAPPAAAQGTPGGTDTDLLRRARHDTFALVAAEPSTTPDGARAAMPSMFGVRMVGCPKQPRSP